MKTLTKTQILVLCLATACLSACARQVEEAPPPEIPTLDLTSWTDKTELFMEYPAARGRGRGALRRTPDSSERFLGDDDGPAAAGVHA